MKHFFMISVPPLTVYTQIPLSRPRKTVKTSSCSCLSRHFPGSSCFHTWSQSLNHPPVHRLICVTCLHLVSVHNVSS